MITERCKGEDAQRNQRGDSGIDEHPEHQSLVHDREQLAALADESEPLGPWRDESGRRCVHQSALTSLEWPECLAGSGASGSTFAIRTGFVIGLAEATAALSTDFFWAGFGVAAASFDDFSAGVLARLAVESSRFFVGLADFSLEAARVNLASGFSAADLVRWAAARPDFSTDFLGTGLAAVAGF